MNQFEEIEIIKKRALKGVLILTSRTFFLQLISLLATFLLTIFLEPNEYGVFFVVSAVVNFLVYFSDIGLAAALIQKKEKLNSDDLKTTFTIQQLLVIFLVFLTLIFSNNIASFYKLSERGLWLFRALIFSFFLSSLKTIPSIILERELYFKKLVIPGIVETLVFYLTAVFLAWQGWGITSFTWAVILRGLSGLFLIYILMPWKPALGIVGNSAKKLLSFGLPFQVNSLLALIKDDLLTAFLGKILTFNELGYIGWAQKWAYFPLRFFMDSINKVTFPTYARIQQEKKILAKAIEKSIYFISILLFPTLVGLVLTAPAFIDFFPRYQKWQPALTALVFFSLNAFFASISTTLTNVLNAIGRVKTTLKLMVFWTITTWFFTLVFIKFFGFNGVAMASALVAATSWLTVGLTQKVVSFNFWCNIKDALIATLMMSISFKLYLNFFVFNLFSLIIGVLIHIFVYFFILRLIGRKRFFLELRAIFKK